MIAKKLYCLAFFLLMTACVTKGNDTPTLPASPPPEAGTRPATGGGVVDNRAPTEIEPVTIRFAVREWEKSRYTSLIQLFAEENPEIRVELVFLEEILGLSLGNPGWPEDAYVRLATSADVWDTGASGEAIRDGLVLDLTPLMVNHSFDVDDFYPGVLEQTQRVGGRWFLPTELYYMVMFFDKQAFDRAGLDYPQPGWSWDDFLLAAQALTMSEGDKVTQWGFIAPHPNGLDFVHAQTGPLFDSSGTPPVARLNSPEVVEAVSWFTDLFLVHEVAPNFLLNTENNGPGVDGWQMIRDGQAGMWVDRSSSWAFWSREMDVGIVPFPVGVERLETTHAQTNAFSISAATTHPNESWRWLAFLSEQLPPQTSGPAVPARRSVAEAGSFWQNLDEEVAATFRYAIDHSYWWSAYILNLEGANLYSAFSEAVTAILSGTTSVADALDKAQAEAQLSIEQAWLEREQVAAVPPPPVVQPGTDSEGALTIEFMIADTLRIQAYRDLAQQFETENPGVRVRIRQPAFGGGPVTLASIAADADCFQWLANDLHKQDSRVVILNLEPFMDVDPAIGKEDFFSGVLSQFTYEGQLYALPGDVSIPLIEFNKALFDAAGVPYPNVGWTTNDFFDIALTLTGGEGDNKRYGFVPGVFEFNDMLNLIQRRGAKLVDDTVTPLATTFDDPSTIEAMRWFVSLTAEYEIKPLFVTIGVESAPTDFDKRHALIENGRTAMWSRLDFSSLTEPDTDHLDVGFAPLPLEPHHTQAGGFQFARGYFISANTQVRQECWQWITFLSRHAVASGLSAHREVAESPAFVQQVGPERAAAYIASLEQTGHTPYLQYMTGEYSWLAPSTYWLVTAYDEILKGEISVEDALRKAQSAANEYRSCVMARNAYVEQEIQQACVQEVKASLLTE